MFAPMRYDAAVDPVLQEFGSIKGSEGGESRRDIIIRFLGHDYCP